MSQFMQHPDGLVYVRTETGTYEDTNENFVADFGQPLPPLPAGAITRIYEQGAFHALNSSNSTIDGGPREWAYGDSAIAAIASLLAAQAARKAAIAAAAKAARDAEIASVLAAQTAPR